MTSSDSTTDTATWRDPNGPWAVVYSLPIFHEIDFAVNEGYRRIPYGGVETGGILFGQIDGARIRLEAFRAIDCEHVFGPSFKLSPKDVQGIRDQINASGSDPELSRFAAVGWYIAHTRSELILTEQEAGIFDVLFPGAGKLTMLVKPEKFKPTRFTFLVRNGDGSFPRDGAQTAFILPLPGQRSSAATKAEPEDQGAALASPPPEPRIAAPDQLPEPAIQEPVPVESVPLPEPELPAPVPKPASVPSTPRTTAAESDIADRTIHPSPERRLTVPERIDSRQEVTSELVRDKRAPVRFTFMLIIAAILGCGLGYWAYLQLPPAFIPVRVQPQAGGFVVTWPVDSTRDAGYLAIRVNDSEPRPVSPADRNAGHLQIQMTADQVKVELIAHYWMRDARGIVRWVGGPSPARSR